METFKVVGIVPNDRLSYYLKLFERDHIPYNVELHRERVARVPGSKRPSGGSKQVILEALASGSKTSAQLTESIVAAGYSHKTIYTALHKLKVNKLIKRGKNGLELIKKRKA